MLCGRCPFSRGGGSELLDSRRCPSGICVGHTRSESTNRDISTSRAPKQRYPSEANHNEWGRIENISGAFNRRDVPCQTRLHSKKMTAFELLFGRKLRTSLDSLVPLLDGATQTTSVPARLKPVRRSGRIGQASVRHYLAGEANSAVILASTLQCKPYRNRAVGRYGFERSRPTNRHSPAATEVGGVRVAGGEPKRATKALTDTSRSTSRHIRDTVEGREQTCTGNN